LLCKIEGVYVTRHHERAFVVSFPGNFRLFKTESLPPQAESRYFLCLFLSVFFLFPQIRAPLCRFADLYKEIFRLLGDTFGNQSFPFSPLQNRFSPQGSRGLTENVFTCVLTLRAPLADCCLLSVSSSRETVGVAGTPTLWDDFAIIFEMFGSSVAFNISHDPCAQGATYGAAFFFAKNLFPFTERQNVS